MGTTDGPLAYARENRARFVRELQEFVRFPSISAQPAHARDVTACARWLKDHLRNVGLPVVRVFATRGHPIVYGEWGNEAGRPTVLIYGHYDVQPPDPLSQWRSPPFEPTIQGGYLHGRGACDDKGQLFTHVKAVESYLRTVGRLPVNLRCVFEGEEEIGSGNLEPFVERYRDRLAADAAVVSDMRMLGPGRPAITYSLRGAVSLEVEVRGPAQDLHSGNFGGAVHNPLEALCSILATLHDRRGRVAVRGFYDRVRTWSSEERSEMARVGPPDEAILRDATAATGWGEPGFSLYERTTIRPCLVINGIAGGYQGPGTKAVIPARAAAKLNARLVPDQDPQEIARRVHEHVRAAAPASVRTAVRTSLMASPALVPRHHPILHIAAMAYRRGFRAEPTFLRSGGTIPVVNMFQKTLGIPTALMGFALPDDRIHAPNERFLLANFYDGIATSIWTLAGIGATRTQSRESSS